MAKVMAVLEHRRDTLETTCRCCKESQECFAGSKDAAQVLGVKLHTDVPLVVLQLDNLHTLACFVSSNEHQARVLQGLHHLGVDLVAVTVSLPDVALLPVELAQPGPFSLGLEDSAPFSKTHRSAHLGLVDFRHVDDDGLLALFVELGAACLVHAANILGVFHHRKLHAQADTKVGNVVHPSPSGSLHHSLCSPLAKTTGHKDPVCCRDRVPGFVIFSRSAFLGRIFEVGCINPEKIQLLLTVHGGMFQCLAHTEIRVMETSVFSNQGNRHCPKDLLLASSKPMPVLPNGLSVVHKLRVLGDSVDFEDAAECVEEPLAFKEDGDLVGRRDVVDSNNLVPLNLARIGDLLNGALRKRSLTAAGNLNWSVGSKAKTPKERTKSGRRPALRTSLIALCVGFVSILH